MRSSSTTRSYSSSSSTLARSSGGKRASGRYRAYDSAQLLYSTAFAFPTRQSGTRIDSEDWRLSIPPPITSRDSEGYAPPQPAQVSTPCTYRLDLRVREDNARYTLDELVRDGTSKALRTHAAVPRGQTWNGRPSTYTTARLRRMMRHARARVYARTYSNTPHHTDTD